MSRHFTLNTDGRDADLTDGTTIPSADRLMGITTLSLAELRALPEKEKLRRLSAFASARKQPPNGEATFLAEKIADFEKRYEMSSATMQHKLADGKLRETADVCVWLMLLEAKESLAGSAS